MFSHKFFAIGTQWQIDIPDSYSQKFLSILPSINSRINAFDNNFSRFLTHSWVIKISEKPGSYTMPNDFKDLLDIYAKLYILTNKKFTPLIGRLMEDAGYDKEYTLKQKKTLASPPDFIQSVEIKGQEITLKEKVLFDVGAAGKGYLVDIISSLLDNYGIKSYCVDAGGDIYYKSSTKESLKVGLEDPDDSTLVIGIAEILNESICASAGNRRKWGNFHHTIDPTTLKSPNLVKSVWVVASSALIADALTTCLTLVPNPEKFSDFKFECVLLYKDNKAYISKGFPGELFTN